MNLSKIHKFEQAVVSLLNNEGWQLEWCGGGFEHFDAIGVTPKKKEVIKENNKPNLTAGSKFDFKYFWEMNKRKVNKKAPIGKCSITG